MNLLAIDCATSVISVTLGLGEKIEHYELEAGTNQSESIMDFIIAKVEKSGLLPKDINGVLCMGGPGSFTGLRLGFSIAKGLSLALDIPFVPVPTLDCIALHGRTAKNDAAFTLAVTPAVKGSFFYALFRKNEKVTADNEATLEEICDFLKNRDFGLKNETLVIAGSGADVIFEALPPENRENIESICEKKGYAKELIFIAKKQDIFHNYSNAPLFSGPQYVRKTDAEKNLIGKTG